MTRQEEISTLKQTIERDRERVAALQTQYDQLYNDLTNLKARYDDLIAPLVIQVDMVRRELTKLEQARLYRDWTPPPDYVPVQEQYHQSWVSGEKTTTIKEDSTPPWTPPPDYVPVEEQYRRKWTPHEAPPTTEADFIPPPPEPEPQDLQKDLKTLYRHLARRYHPDFAKNEADLALRTRLMAEINLAYENEDIDILRALFTVASSKDKPTESVEVLQLRQLKYIQNDLRRRIFALKQQIHDLENSDLMRLKHEEWRLKLQGRNLLKEMAGEFQREYEALRRKLYNLRREK